MQHALVYNLVLLLNGINNALVHCQVNRNVNIADISVFVCAHVIQRSELSLVVCSISLMSVDILILLFEFIILDFKWILWLVLKS